MESRTRLAISGMATVAASVAVICVVALTNSQALTDSAGAPIGAAPVVVPASGAPAAGDAGEAAPAVTPTPTTQPSPSAEPREPAATDPVPPQTSPAEIVPAQEAQDVTPTRPASPSSRPAEPAAPSTEEEAIAEAVASGSWERVRAWAEGKGWPVDRIDAFIARLEREMSERLQDSERRSERVDVEADSNRVSAPADPESDAAAVAGRPEDRSASRGARADHRPKVPVVGEKKDRSRQSPPMRDR